MIRATHHLKRQDSSTSTAFDTAVLAHDERHLRRKLVRLQHGEEVLVDLPEPVMLEHGDMLLLEDRRTVGIVAAEEELYSIAARDALHLTELAWHLGNRHLPAQIEKDRILILRDPIIRGMLEGLDAGVSEVVEPFQPTRGAYHSHGGHSHAHDPGNGRPHEHGHDHAARGHNHHHHD